MPKLSGIFAHTKSSEVNTGTFEGPWDKPSVHQKHQTSYFREMKLMGNARTNENMIYNFVSPSQVRVKYRV